jgi:hypothetical protein
MVVGRPEEAAVDSMKDVGPVRGTPGMTTRTDVSPRLPADAAGPAHRLAAWVGWATAGVGVVALTVAVGTPPRSGPFCTTGCVGYPYTDVGAFVPRDYLWLYPATLLVILAVVLLACLPPGADSEAQVLARAGQAFSAVAAATLILAYAVQLSVVQPSLLRGQTDGLSLLSQYNPHGVFIAAESVGYLALAIAFLLIGAACGPAVARGIRWTLLAGGTLTIAAAVALSVAYRADLEYRFEVIAILIDWLVLIATGILLGLASRRHRSRG